MPLCAFLGTLFSISAVYTAAARRSFSNTALILSGVILGFLFASLVLLVYSISSPSKVYSTMLWLMGDLAGTDTHLLQIAASLIPAGTVVLLLFSGNLDLLALGEEKAFLLGMNTSLTRKTLFVVASLITGTCVAVSGVIGFIGLMIPHLLRRVTGPGHRVLLPASALGGAIFLPLCDTIARTVIAPVELPVGVITGIIGALFFLIVFAQKTAEC
jgi:iron complex transport system permease protein